MNESIINDVNLVKPKIELKDKIKLYQIALECIFLFIEIFNIEDSDYVDHRIVVNKERAIENRVKKIHKITGLELDKVEELINSHYPCQKNSDYFEVLRTGGIPIATLEEVIEYEKGKEK